MTPPAPEPLSPPDRSAAAFTVPTVDLTNDPPAAIVDALRSASCAFVVGHGVPASLVEEMVATSTAFFDQPRELKAPTRWPGDGLWRGWQPVNEGAADLTGDRLPDPLERFEIQLSGFRPTPDASSADLTASFALWPDRPAGFADVWTRYYSALGELAAELMGRIITALDLETDDEAAWREDHYSNLVAINYLPQPDELEPEQIRIRAHTDRGGLTLLWADQSPGGLEVMLPASREWVPVMIPANAFLLQAGDLLTRWTNYVIKPNIHRVVNPPADVAAHSRRISIPYFHYPRLDITVAPAASCLSDERRPAHAVVARDHVMFRQDEYKTGDYSGVDEVLAVV